MIITYNCALDAMVLADKFIEAENLFKEIDFYFKADYITYSTIIKGLGKNDQQQKAFEYLKEMLEKNQYEEPSVLNMFLEGSSNHKYCQLGIRAFDLALQQKIVPNEITFGIMVKIFGFARNLRRAFELVEEIENRKMRASIIFFTNLIHISFMNKNPRKADLAFKLFKKTGGKGDSLMFSKLIEGSIKSKRMEKIGYYLKFVKEEKTGLNPKTIGKINQMTDEYVEMLKTIE